MIYALVRVHKGIIDDVRFYFNEKEAVKALDQVVQNMAPEHDDAAVFGPNGMVANAKMFLGENEEYAADALEEVLKQCDEIDSVYIIGNPCHDLGFMVASPDDPLGYENPVEAVSDLGQMRKDHGKHLKLYRVIPVDGPVAKKTDVERLNRENEVEDFDYSLVAEYLNPD